MNTAEVQKLESNSRVAVYSGVNASQTLIQTKVVFKVTHEMS